MPVPSLRPWAGRRLSAAVPGAGGAAGTLGVGELWVAGPESTVNAGPLGSVTLDELAGAAGEAFVGYRAMALLGPRFPLLVKVIDAADWLSLQVHPSDALAAELYGPGSLGKTEAWIVIDADPGARLVTGPAAGLAEDALRSRIADGTLDRPDCEERPAVPGDTWLIAAGTVHAIGAGTLVYEIEQPSDLTFRISDWGRPAIPGRHLHTAEALRAVRPDARAVSAGQGWTLGGGALTVREFRLELLAAGGSGGAEGNEGRPAAGSPGDRVPAGASLEIVTALRGRIALHGDGWSEALEPFETVVVPASVPAYRIEVPAGGVAAIGSVP